jgi:hypothetical protein
MSKCRIGSVESFEAVDRSVAKNASAPKIHFWAPLRRLDDETVEFRTSPLYWKLENILLLKTLCQVF